jgi:ferredoxin-NADP reductase
VESHCLSNGRVCRGSGNAFQPGEDEQIIGYLSATQTPDAVNRRRAQVTAASSSGRSMVTPTVAAVADRPAPPSRYDVRTLGFIAFVFLSMLTLVVRRPSRDRLAGAGSNPPVVTVKAPLRAVSANSPSGGPLVLRLASAAQQTSDAKTLRFIVPDGRRFSARPGQFLTFSFLFDGKKVIRSYSICSSAARSGYIEITPKRVEQGCVSVFLNDRASVGMTVEANGPYGQFCLDESKHHNVVMLAAGSGITPMMAMLRYIDDLRLETAAILLYCVRTNKDIIFESELAQLRSRLKTFEYHVLLSQPHKEWSGPRGHVSREFIENTVSDIELPHFFLCGPPSFMEASRAILIGLGVKSERIMQESFGSSAPRSAQPVSAAETGVVIEFVRSGQAYSVRGGQTLLEAAEEHGVGIPSSCRQGQCGTCKTKLLAGNVHMDAEEGLYPDSRAQGFVLTCVGHADGDVRLDA